MMMEMLITSFKMTRSGLKELNLRGIKEKSKTASKIKKIKEAKDLLEDNKSTKRGGSKVIIKITGDSSSNMTKNHKVITLKNISQEAKRTMTSPLNKFAMMILRTHKTMEVDNSEMEITIIEAEEVVVTTTEVTKIVVTTVEATTVEVTTVEETTTVVITTVVITIVVVELLSVEEVVEVEAEDIGMIIKGRNKIKIIITPLLIHLKDMTLTIITTLPKTKTINNFLAEANYLNVVTMTMTMKIVAVVKKRDKAVAAIGAVAMVLNVEDQAEVVEEWVEVAIMTRKVRTSRRWAAFIDSLIKD
jgi:hypothetical protein